MAVESPGVSRVLSREQLEAAIQRCAQEPIQHVGQIQSHGALLVVHPQTERITHASVNIERWLGVGPKGVIGAPWDHFIELVGGLGFSGVARSESRLLVGRRAAQAGMSTDAPGGVGSFLVTVSRGESVLLELTEMRSPGADTGGGGELFQDRLRPIFESDTLKEQHELLAEFVRELLGYDRVMVYRFDESWNGQVVAESKSDRIGSLLGMHFPASDIPEQARRLYARTPVRVIMDVDGTPAQIVPPCSADTGSPVDLSDCSLRWVSPVHLQYLRNIGVRASLSISLMQGDRLWGLIACHHLAPRLIPASKMQIVRVMSSLVSSHLTLRFETERLRRAARLGDVVGAMRRLPATLDAPDSRVWEAMRCFADSIGAEEIYAVLQGRAMHTGARALPSIGPGVLAYLQENCDSDVVYCTRSLPSVWPEATDARDVACGLLAIRVGLDWSNAVLFFKPELVEEVTWAGRVEDTGGKQLSEDGRLNPRASFAAWVSRVELTSGPFEPEDIAAADDLRAVLTDIVVHQSKRELRQVVTALHERNKEMEEFVYTVSHDLKAPLVTIDAFLKKSVQAFSEGESGRGLEMLGRVQTATTQMQQLLGGLLEISRIGRSGAQNERVVLAEAIEQSVRRVKYLYHSEPAFEVRVSGEFGEVIAHAARIGQVFDNLLGNAVKYGLTDQSRVIEARGEVRGGASLVRVRDYGAGVEPRFAEAVFQLFRRVDETGREGTGVGLAIVRRVMHALGGSVELDTSVKPGAEFVLRFPAAPQRGEVHA